MSIYLDTSTVPPSSTDSKVHLMPCEIEYNADAKVEQYFQTSIRENVDEETKRAELTACFRGRPLNGKIQTVPSGFTGIVMKEARRPFTEEEDRNFTVSQKFDKFHYWNLDKKPSPDDRFQQALDWIEISKVLHRPLDMDDSQKSVVGN